MPKAQVEDQERLLEIVGQLNGESLNYLAAIAQTLKFAQDATQHGGPDTPDTTKKAS